MTDFIDYDGILVDLQSAVQTANLGFKNVLVDADARDYLIPNMPLLDIRVKRVVPEPVTNATYYGDMTIEAEICAFDLTSRRKAAKLRNDLTNALHAFVKANPRFSSHLETTVIGQVDFGTGESKAEGAFVAGAVCELHPRLYSE